MTDEALVAKKLTALEDRVRELRVRARPDAILTDVELNWRGAWIDKNNDGWPDVFNWRKPPDGKDWPTNQPETLPVYAEKFKYRVRYTPLQGEVKGVTLVQVEILAAIVGKRERVTTFMKLIAMR